MAVTLEALDVKLDAVIGECQELKDMMRNLNSRTRDNEIEIARMHEQLKLRSIMLAGLSSILAGIAAAVGWQR